MLFERAYCNQAVRAPSRKTLLTGRRPDTLGIYDLGTNFRIALPDAVTLPQHFKANGHGIWRKHTNYEQATRIPILIVAPGVTVPGSRTGALVETVDLYPTLCQLAALPLPVGQIPFDGQSLVPVLKDPNTRHKDAIVHVYPRHPRGRGMVLGRAVRTERYRLVEWKSPGANPDTAELELYDYQEDPMETQNVAASRPEVTADLRSILARLPEAQPQVTTPARP